MGQKWPLGMEEGGRRVFLCKKRKMGRFGVYSRKGADSAEASLCGNFGKPEESTGKIAGDTPPLKWPKRRRGG